MPINSVKNTAMISERGHDLDGDTYQWLSLLELGQLYDFHSRNQEGESIF